MANLRPLKTLTGIPLPRLFWSLAAGLVLLLTWIAPDYGITWDEWMDSNNGMLTLRYILTLGRDTSYTQFWHGYLYSGLFYSVVGTVYGVMSGSLHNFVFDGLHQDLHLLRFFQTSHWINALFGCTAMIFTGLLARLIAGWRAGILALFFMILSPRFFGASFNDPKDIPMAAGYVMALYFMVRFLMEQPKPRFSTSVLLAFSIAAAIGARAAGLILLPYLFLFSGVYWLSSPKDQRVSLASLALSVGLIAIGGYFGGLIFWPYALQNPIVNPAAGLAKLSNFSFWQGVVLFEGRQVTTDKLPWYYVLKWIFISVPFFIHLGLAFLGLRASSLIRRIDWRLITAVIFTFAFPLAFQILRKSTVLDSWRHFFFVYPPMAAAAALAWDHLWEENKGRLQRLALGALLGILLFLPLEWMLRNHPHEYTYFNESTGGLSGALGNYETDYWANSMRGCAEWLGSYHASRHPGQKAVVRSDSSIMSTYPFLRKALGDTYIPYGYPEDFIRKDPYFFINYPPLSYKVPGWDYGILMTRGWDPAALRRREWPGTQTLYEVKADDIPLCAVIENPAKA